MNIITSILLIAFSIITTSCNRQNLYVQNEYITYEHLASYYVGTPDPRKECPDTGQRLLVRWSIPKRCLIPGKSSLTLQMRYGNGEEKIITRDLERSSGTMIYDLFNKEYFCKRGILTYKATITVADEIIEEWVHQIWTDKIDFNL